MQILLSRKEATVKLGMSMVKLDEERPENT